MQPDEVPTKKKQKRKTSQLEQDMIFEIMLELPLKSVVRFKAVSKQWCNLITDSVFARTHFSKHQDISSFILRSNNPEPRIKIINVKEAEKASSCGKLFQQVSIPLPTISILRFHNCCDGILCASSLTSGRIFLWNPITKWTKKIDYPFEIDYVDTYFVGFGYDSSIEDYKVVRIAPKHIEVMNLKSNAWRIASSVLPECLCSLKRSYRMKNEWTRIATDDFQKKRRFISSQPVHLNGNLYWKVWIEVSGYLIIRFDLKKEKLSIVQKPSEDFKFWHMPLCMMTSFRGKLCFVRSRNLVCYEIWLMKEESDWDKVDVNWDKKVIAPGIHYFPMCGIYEAIVLCNDTKIPEHEFIAEDSEKRERHKNIINSEICTAYGLDKATQYVGSLISPHT